MFDEVNDHIDQYYGNNDGDFCYAHLYYVSNGYNNCNLHFDYIYQSVMTIILMPTQLVLQRYKTFFVK